MCIVFFFFQAEDGIRDYKVTGVQTCALPIYRVEVPPPIRPPLFPEKIQRESHPRVRPIPEGGHEIEADEQIVIVVEGVVEPVPRRVFGSLLVQFFPQVVLSPEFDRALHALSPLLFGIHREGAHAFPRVEVPTTPKTTPAAVLVPILDKPLERAADRRMVRVTELHERARRVPGRAEVAFLGTFHSEPAIVSSVSFDPSVAGLFDSRIGLAQPEVCEDEQHPVRGQVLRLVKALPAHPPSRSVLLREDLLGPSFPRNHVPGAHDLRVVKRSSEQLSQREIADGRLVLLEQPVQRALWLHFLRATPGRVRSPWSWRRSLR